MFKIISFICCIFLSLSIASGQDYRTLQILSITEDKNEMQVQSAFLIPFIEKTISKLRDFKKDELLFQEVYYLNRYRDLDKIAKIKRGVFKVLNPSKNFEDNTKSQKLAALNAEKIYQSNLFLIVKIAELGSLLEYQFYLHEDLRTDIKDSLSEPILNPVPISTANIFINPTNQHYLVDLENAIKTLFPQSNTPPTTQIYLNKKIYQGKALYFAVDDTVSIDLRTSFDSDTPKEQIAFSTKQIISKNIENRPENLISLIFNAPQNHFIAKNLGQFLIEIFTFDGITTSKKDTLDINIIERPKITLLNPSIDFIDFYRFKFLKNGTFFAANCSRKNGLIEKSGNLNIWYAQKVKSAYANKKFIDYTNVLLNPVNYKTQKDYWIDGRIERGEYMYLDTSWLNFKLKSCENNYFQDSTTTFLSEKTDWGHKVALNQKQFTRSRTRKFYYNVSLNDRGVVSNTEKLNINYLNFGPIIVSHETLFDNKYNFNSTTNRTELSLVLSKFLEVGVAFYGNGIKKLLTFYNY